MPRPAVVGRSALFAVTCVAAVASVPLSAGLEPAIDTAAYPLNAVVLGLAGLLIGLKLPRHRIGLLLVVLGLTAALVELVEGYGYHDTWWASLTAQWVASWASQLGAASTATLLALFPDGGAAGRRWRWVPPFTIFATVLITLTAAFGHMNDKSSTLTRGGNPHAVDGLVGLTLVAEFGFAASRS